MRNAKRIVILKDGGVVEMAEHEELLVKGGSYHHLYEMPFRQLEVETRQGVGQAADNPKV